VAFGDSSDPNHDVLPLTPEAYVHFIMQIAFNLSKSPQYHNRSNFAQKFKVQGVSEVQDKFLAMSHSKNEKNTTAGM
jgi:hypothetical protein